MKNILFILTLACLTSCNFKGQVQRKSFTDNISQSDTICLQEIAKAKKDINQHKLTYYHLWGLGGSSLRYEQELDSLLNLYGIRYSENVFSCLIGPTQENCYEMYMNEEVIYRYGSDFIDSLKYIADSIYIFKHYDEFIAEDFE